MRSKKGVQYATMLNLVIVIALLWLTWSVLGGFLSGWFEGSGPEKAAKDNFNSLTENVKELLDREPHNFDTSSMVFSLPSDYVVAGFGTDTEKFEINPSQNVGVTNTLGIDPIYKPSMCTGAACLCLYTYDGIQLGKNNRDEGIVSCNIFSSREYGKLNFTGFTKTTKTSYIGGLDLGLLGISFNRKSLTSGEKRGSGDLEHFFLYSHENNNLNSGKKLYLEENNKNGKKEIIMSPAGDSLKLRKYNVNSCPSNSGECSGKNWGEVVTINGENYACSYNHDKGFCEVNKNNPLKKCPEGRTSASTCKCGDKAMSPGNTCKTVGGKRKIFMIDCTAKTSCTDYCPGSGECSAFQKGLCEKNICNIQGGCDSVMSGGYRVCSDTP